MSQRPRSEIEKKFITDNPPINISDAAFYTFKNQEILKDLLLDLRDTANDIRQELANLATKI